MKKVYGFLLFLLLLIIPVTVNGVSKEDVDYKIKNYYVYSDIDIAGSLNVKELIVLDGTFNGYIRDIEWLNENLGKFTGKDKDFEGSDIYNGSNIAKLKVGTININGTAKFDDIFKKPKFFKESKRALSGDSGVYELSKGKYFNSVKLYEETENNTTAFYLEYVITGLTVKHNDVAEFYYNYIGKDFDDDIEKMQIVTMLPEGASKEKFKFWAHGPLNGTIQKYQDNKGVNLSTTNLKRNTPVDVRITYDTELFPVSIDRSKITNINAMDKILKVEKKRAEDANKQRRNAKIAFYVIFIGSIVYLVSLLLVAVYVYFKHDKELESTFKDKYYRNIIEDYPPEVVQYIMNKNIDEKSFTASIVNLIRKKNIDVVKTKDGKEYIFTKKNEKDLNSSEQIIMDLLFGYVSDNADSFTTKELKKAAKRQSGGKIPFYEKFEEWKASVVSEALTHEFYFENDKFKTISVIYGLLGFLLAYLVYKFTSVIPLMIALIGLSVIFIVYIGSVKKRTSRGNEDYNKWKAFRNFLNDFGRFDEKELPEVRLWEKLLVYATIFGLADKVSKEMKIKIETMDTDMSLNSNLFLNYWIMSNLSSTVSSAVASSVTNAQSAHSSLSSGSGSGGGFSGGGGFGGGGGGGRGF